MGSADSHLTKEQEEAIRWEAKKLAVSGVVPEKLKDEKAALDKELEQGHPNGIRNGLSRFVLRNLFGDPGPSGFSGALGDNQPIHVSQAEVEKVHKERAQGVQHYDFEAAVQVDDKQKKLVEKDLKKFEKKVEEALVREISADPEKISHAVEEYKAGHNLPPEANKGPAPQSRGK